MRITKTPMINALLATMAIVACVGVSLGQYQSDLRSLVQRIQAETNTLRTTVQNAADRNNYPVDEFNRMANDFSTATTQFDRRLRTNRATASDARLVLDRAAQIDSFFTSNRLGYGSQRAWQTLRSDLDQLARTYNLNWQWNSGGTGGTNSGGTSGANLSNADLRQLALRLDTNLANFSRSLRQDLSSRRSDVRYPTEQVRQQLTTFESAEYQLRNRINTRQVSAGDVQSLIQPATFLNNYVTSRQLSYQTTNSWSSLRQDMDQLANAFNVAVNWSTGPVGDTGTGNRAGLTGTFQLNTNQSDDVRNAVDAATRNLSLAERQRVYDSLVRRLDSPQMLALDRRGSSISIASTRAPQANFVADGREQVETTNNGRTIRVRASLVGNQLTITRTGERANDFTVTFDPQDYGRRLLVTRTLYSDRLTQTVTVRTSYDRVSDVAQLNLYETNREDTTAGNVSGDFAVPSGTQLVAVLNNDLSTQNVQQNDRFSMTVRSPGQYEGATIEGYVAAINRGGRVTGRSEMTLDFDTIRLRDGRSNRFAGILESVQTQNGDVVRVDNEGAVRDSDQTNKTITRTAIGSAVGAIIGAIAGGGKGAAIGAAVGAGAGAGSVYIQGRNDLDLRTGTELTIRSTGPRQAQ